MCEERYVKVGLFYVGRFNFFDNFLIFFFVSLVILSGFIMLSLYVVFMLGLKLFKLLKFELFVIYLILCVFVIFYIFLNSFFL